MKITGPVYILVYGDGYSGSTIDGAFSSEDKAWKYARKQRSIFNENTSVDYMQDCGYWVYEEEMDPDDA